MYVGALVALLTCIVSFIIVCARLSSFFCLLATDVLFLNLTHSLIFFWSYLGVLVQLSPAQLNLSLLSDTNTTLLLDLFSVCIYARVGMRLPVMCTAQRSFHSTRNPLARPCRYSFVSSYNISVVQYTVITYMCYIKLSTNVCNV